MKNTFVSIAAGSLVVAQLVACSSSDAPSDTTSTTSTLATISVSTVTSTASGAGGAGQGGAGGSGIPDCFTSPMTHVEIINGCTDAEAVDKVVNLPLLNSDGSLPPLP